MSEKNVMYGGVEELNKIRKLLEEQADLKKQNQPLFLYLIIILVSSNTSKNSFAICIISLPRHMPQESYAFQFISS